MKKAIRPAIFKWRQTEPELILDSTGATIDFVLSLSGLRDLSPEEHQRVLDLPHQPCL